MAHSLSFLGLDNRTQCQSWHPWRTADTSASPWWLLLFCFCFVFYCFWTFSEDKNKNMSSLNILKETVWGFWCLLIFPDLVQVFTSSKKMCILSHDQLFVLLGQPLPAPLSMGSSRHKDTGVDCHFHSPPGDLPTGIEPKSLCLLHC